MPHPRQHLERARLGLARCRVAVAAHRLGDLLADAKGGVQRGHRLLKDHRHPVAAQRAIAVERRQIVGASLEVHAALPDADDVAWQKAHQRQRGDALAAAGLAHDAKRLARGDLQRHVLHEVEVTPPQPQAQILDPPQRLDRGFRILRCRSGGHFATNSLLVGQCRRPQRLSIILLPVRDGLRYVGLLPWSRRPARARLSALPRPGAASPRPMHPAHLRARHRGRSSAARPAV